MILHEVPSRSSGIEISRAISIDGDADRVAARTSEVTPLEIAELKTFRCAACNLDIVLQDGHYRLVDRRYHLECYDREMAPDPSRTLWMRPPMFTPFDSDNSVAEAP